MYFWVKYQSFKAGIHTVPDGAPVSDPPAVLGLGISWKGVYDYASQHPVTPQAKIGVGALNNTVSMGFRQLDRPLPVDPDDHPCLSLAHCENGLKDCGESAVDVGGGCPSKGPCFNKPSKRAGTFRFEMQLFGIKPDGTAEQINTSGSVASDSYFFYPVLYYNKCDCSYFWDQSTMETLKVRIGQSNLKDYVSIEAQL